jgi:hypothetical protein
MESMERMTHLDASHYRILHLEGSLGLTTRKGRMSAASLVQIQGVSKSTEGTGRRCEHAGSLTMDTQAWYSMVVR